jgi:hypothetical protein
MSINLQSRFLSLKESNQGGVDCIYCNNNNKKFNFLVENVLP